MFFTERVIVVEQTLWNTFYTPKGLPPIWLKKQTNQSWLDQCSQTEDATWFIDGVTRSGGIPPWNFPLLPVLQREMGC